MKDYRRAKVQKMGYVYFSPDKSYYSVPYRYIGHRTQIHYTKSWVEVYFNNQRIAIHKRNRANGSYNTIKEHLSSTHQKYTQWSPEFFKNMAKAHGESVMLFVEALILGGDYPEVGYRRAMGVIQLHKQYGSVRLNNACERALYGQALSYNAVKNILKNNLDKEHQHPLELEDNKPHIPKHENIRGATAYN